ncbi:MAG TPA: polysaccharide deacetylase family protein [Acidimicrobiales bacterium]|nr:polysaccharide deacetylase family protein [Acidimicrobiales bacterium]
MSATVLAYHAVADAPPASDPHHLVLTTRHFAAQMDELARSRTVVPLEDVVRGRVKAHGRPVVAITFDDGYRGVLECAGPILARFGFPATLFVPTAHLGNRNTWDDLHDDAFKVLRADELAAVEALGVRVESHGHAHIPYDSSLPETVAEDLAQSVAVLEEVLGRRPRFLAYPYGPSSLAARQMVVAAGFEAAFSIDARHGGRFSFGRIPIQTSDSMRLFRFKTSGRYQFLRQNAMASVMSSATRPVRRFLHARRGAAAG